MSPYCAKQARRNASVFAAGFAPALLRQNLLRRLKDTAHWRNTNAPMPLSYLLMRRRVFGAFGAIGAIARDLVAHAVLTAYNVARKRRAATGKDGGQGCD